MNTYFINGSLFADMIKSGAANLRNNSQIVNDLNVFPIPDGDTGENMSMTMSGGVKQIPDDTGSLSFVADKVVHGMLMSARGNSGVILSQFFEGIRKGFSGVESADLTTLSEAFKSGVHQAYSSVIDPTEGTILTVMREATDSTLSLDLKTCSVETFFETFISEMYASLERTPDLLPVLKEAGVIDSGGAGFVYIIEGMNCALHGNTVEQSDGSTISAPTTIDTSNFDRYSEMKYGYCTELIVQLTDAKIDVDNYDVNTLVSYLESIGGDSIVAFKTDTRVKLHVHTFTPEKVLEYCHTLGEFVTLKVENMSIQHTETNIQNRFVRPTSESSKNHKPYACVAVAEGEGLIAALKELGADYVIDGNQTMNPSTEDFITAFDAVDADNIFVLPNNSNILLAAKQAAALYTGASVYIIHSTTIAEGYAALTMLDYTSDDPEEIAAGMQGSLESVTTGLVTYAVRDSQIGGHNIKTGDWLGFENKNILSVANSQSEAAIGLLDGIDKTDKVVIIMISGKDADEKDKAAVREYVASLPDIEFFELDGGQDVYSFIFAIE